MKKILLSVISIILLFASSCEKDNNDPKGTSNVNIINATVGGGAIKANVGAGTSFVYSKATDLAFGTSGVYGAYLGSNTIKIVSSTDTTKIVFNRTIDLQPISTLYIAGQTPNIDTLFRVEKSLPFIPVSLTNPDNSIYIRFVNLSPNSTPLNITIRSAATNEVTALGYKGISDFKKYDAQSTTPNYIFEVRDAATNTLRATLTLNTNNNRFKTIALIVKGLMGTTTGTDAFGLFQVNYI